MEFKILESLNDDIIEIRREAFVLGRGVPEEIELDGRDDELLHFCMYDGEKLMAYLRAENLGDFMHIGRVCVKSEQRGNGCGKALMQFLFDYARKNNISLIELSAVDTAVGFYEKMGFSAKGDYYLETGVPHIYMKREF